MDVTVEKYAYPTSYINTNPNVDDYLSLFGGWSVNGKTRYEQRVVQKCGDIEKSVSHVSNTYFFYFKNPSKKKIFINSLTFLTQEDDMITTNFIFVKLPPFHKKNITLDKANIIHKFVNKIFLNCDDT